MAEDTENKLTEPSTTDVDVARDYVENLASDEFVLAVADHTGVPVESMKKILRGDEGTDEKLRAMVTEVVLLHMELQRKFDDMFRHLSDMPAEHKRRLVPGVNVGNGLSIPVRLKNGTLLAMLSYSQLMSGKKVTCRQDAEKLVGAMVRSIVSTAAVNMHARLEAIIKERSDAKSEEASEPEGK